MKYSGQCHCGKLKATFETAKGPVDLGVRACQCDFCRRHGAKNISDAQGEIKIEASADDVRRYTFALRTCDFLFCKSCGVYIGAVIGADADKRATLNAAGLGLSDFMGIEETPMQYGSETTEARIARRLRLWTPVHFTDPALEAANFGPHTEGQTIS